MNSTAEAPKGEPSSASTGSSQDQLATLVVDLSPIANTFYGPRNSNPEKSYPATEIDEDEDEALLRAKTRRLDSFRVPSGEKITPTEPEETVEEKEQEPANPLPEQDPADPPPEQADPVSQQDPAVPLAKETPTEEVGGEIEPRNLSSVFDDEARGLTVINNSL